MVPSISRTVFYGFPDLFPAQILRPGQVTSLQNAEKIESKIAGAPNISEMKGNLTRGFISALCSRKGRFRTILFDLITQVEMNGTIPGIQIDPRSGAVTISDLNAASVLVGAASVCYFRSNRLSRFEHDDLSLSSLPFREVPSASLDVSGFGVIKTPWGVNDDVSFDVKQGIAQASGPMQRHPINVKSALSLLPNFPYPSATLHAFLTDMPWYVSCWLTLLATEILWTKNKTWNIDRNHSRLPEDQASVLKGYIGKKWGWKILAGQMQVFDDPNTLSVSISKKNRDKTLYTEARKGWDAVSPFWSGTDSFDRWIQNGPASAYWFNSPFSKKNSRSALVILGDYSVNAPLLGEAYNVIANFIDRYELRFNETNFKGGLSGPPFSDMVDVADPNGSSSADLVNAKVWREQQLKKSRTDSANYYSNLNSPASLANANKNASPPLFNSISGSSLDFRSPSALSGGEPSALNFNPSNFSRF